MTEFDINTLDKNKDYAIKASAGTGKTFNIIRIIEKLTDKNEDSFKKLLIVTYTEKAAGELKNRIRKELNFDTTHASIFTIHSFCQNAIKEFGISAGLPLQMKLIGNNELNEFADGYVRQGNILEDISRFDANPDNVKKNLIGGIDKYYLDLSENEVPEIVTFDNSKFFMVNQLRKCESFMQICTEFPEIKSHYDYLKNSSEEKEKNFAIDIENNSVNGFNFNGKTFQDRYMNTEQGREALLYFKSIKDTFNSIKNKETKGPRNRFVASLYLQDFYLCWQQEKKKTKSETYDDMLRYVREAVINNGVFLKKLKEKYKYGIIDEFQDTNQKQFDIFENIFLKDEDHHLIVVYDDKQSIYSFQGADVAVCKKAIQKITDRGGICCGLSKNWRSTKEMVDACNKYFAYSGYFGTEFPRSNHLLGAPQDPYKHLADFDNAPTKSIWIAIGGNAGLDENVSSAYTKINNYAFARIIAQQIIECCITDKNGYTKLRVQNGKDDKEKRNVSFKDFAILTKTSREMVPIKSALEKAGIPYIRYKDASLFSGKECACWIALLEAIEVTDFTGYNRKKFKKALFTPFFGKMLEETADVKFDKDTTDEMRRLNHWRYLAMNCLWEKMIDDILLHSGLSSYMKSLDELQSGAIYRQIGEYCVDVLSSGNSLDSLISNLSNLNAGGNDDNAEEDNEIIEKSTDFDCVKIMTIHASKGLEFPVVFCAGGYRGLSEFPGGYLYHDDRGTPYLTFDKNSHEEIVKEETEEFKRLFYVAYTRAQFVLMLPYYDKYGYNGKTEYKAFTFLREATEYFLANHKGKIRFVYDNNKTDSDMKIATSEILKTNHIVSASTFSEAGQKIIIDDLIKKGPKLGTYKHSYSNLSHGMAEEDEFDDFVDKEGKMVEGLSEFDKGGIVVNGSYNTLNALKFPADYPKGNKLGTTLHEIFEKLDFNNYSVNLEEIINERFNANRFAIDRHPDWMNATKEMVENVLNADLCEIQGNSKTNGTFKLSSISTDCLKREMEFNSNLPNQFLRNYCNGFIDLVFKRREYYGIVDWKSDGLNDDFASYSDKDELKRHVDNHYSIQRVLYSYYLVKALRLSYRNLSEQEIFNQHFGGIYYVFLRGCNSNTSNGIYAQTWNSWDELNEAFNDIMKKKGIL